MYPGLCGVPGGEDEKTALWNRSVSVGLKVWGIWHQGKQEGVQWPAELQRAATSSRNPFSHSHRIIKVGKDDLRPSSPAIDSSPLCPLNHDSQCHSSLFLSTSRSGGFAPGVFWVQFPSFFPVRMADQTLWWFYSLFFACFVIFLFSVVLHKWYRCKEMCSTSRAEGSAPLSGWSRTGRDLQGMGQTISYSGVGISCTGMFLWTGRHPDPSRQGCFVPFLNSLDSLLVIFFLVPKSLVPSCSLNSNLPILSTKKMWKTGYFHSLFNCFFFLIYLNILNVSASLSWLEFVSSTPEYIHTNTALFKAVSCP